MTEGAFDMRRRIFLRILGLLTLLIIATGTVMSLFQIRIHRTEQIHRGRDKIHFMAGQFESLLLWDDRVAMRQTLVHIMQQDDFVQYAFISRPGKLIAHSFPSRIPAGLLNLPGSFDNESPGPVSHVFEFKIKDNGVVYDLTFPLEPSTSTVLHMGLSRDRIDEAVLPSILGIIAICGLFCLLLVYPAIRVANAITHEVDEMTNRLKKANLVLEERVAERTADLCGANQRLAEGREQLAVTLRSIGDGVITTDVDKKIHLLNRVGETLTGWTQTEATGRPLSDIFHIVSGDADHAADTPADEVLNTGHIVSWSGRAVLTAKDGSERSISLNCAPIKDMNSQTIGVVLVFRDVTETDRMELEMQRSEKLESIGVLAGGIAHDFNNFLAAIQGNINLAQLHTNAGEPIHDYLERADKATMKASDLALRLLTFSKGNVPVRKSVNLEGIVRESAELALSGARTRCKLNIEPNLPSVFVDPGQIGQVFHNLFLNADQAMPNGGEISVKCESAFIGQTDMQIQSGPYLRTTVSDHGVGIPRAQLIKVFDPFFTTKQKGSGLGLAVVHSIIRNHGGSIEIDSQENRGTTFTLYLPITEAHPDVQKSNPARVSGGKGRVLVMDDEEMLRELLSSLLSRVGYSVECAAEGEEAIERFQRAESQGNEFNLLILDLTIPGGMGGIETLRRIREQNQLVRAIATSGYSSDPVIATPEKYGFNASISKPYKIYEVCEIVQNTIASPEASENPDFLH